MAFVDYFEKLQVMTTTLISLGEVKLAIINNPVFSSNKFSLNNVTGFIGDHHRLLLKTLDYCKTKSKWEAAAIFTHVLYLTRGLDELEEDKETSRQEGEYYGRGCLHLKGEHNYIAASKTLFPKEPLKLIKDKELVSSDVHVAWATAAWYWREYVHQVCKDKDFRLTIPLVHKGVTADSEIGKELMEMFEEVSEQMNAKIECTYPDKKFNVIY